MIYVQHPEIEELIRRRLAVIDTSIDERRLLKDRDRGAHAYAWILSLNLQKPSNLVQLCEVLEQLTSEVAGARAAVEHERTMRSL